MTSRHLQQHNMWPTGFTVVWAIGLIFMAGQLYSRIEILERDFTKHSEATNHKLDNMNAVINDLRLANNKPLTVVDGNNKVLGIATSSASLKITPSVTPNPKVTPTTPTVTPTLKP